MSLNPERWTLKTQEAFTAATELAKARNNPEVTIDHLLAALLGQQDGVVLPILQRVGVNPLSLRNQVDDAIGRLPRAYGSEVRVARELRDRSIQLWSAAAVNLVHAYDPEMLILSGGIMNTPEPTRARMQEYLDRHAWTGWGKVRVMLGELGESAALLGMAHLKSRSVRRPPLYANNAIRPGRNGGGGIATRSILPSWSATPVGLACSSSATRAAKVVRASSGSVAATASRAGSWKPVQS